ncbi:hypothetical protein D0C27_02995 [Alcaligenes faecalis]|uniref:hypothetical protein n=1 Tax=Alcaligenes faecalis TaxID=511 RepID=UPI0010CA24EC|nr:hypothetical protein [Alcaligenes faecalis]QCP80911.1 hypothetical protein D0C27_02995 [Alcaligenes faecalis]
MKKAKLILDELAFSRLIFNIRQNVSELECIISAAESANLEITEIFGIKDEEFYSLESDGKNVNEELFSEENTEFRDLVVRLQILVSKWSSLPERGVGDKDKGIGVSILKADGYGALLASTRPDPSCWWDDVKMHLVSVPEDLPLALRKHFIESRIEQKYFPFFCQGMFPNLYFHVSSNNLKNLGVSYTEHARLIIDHFSYLNDFASDHFDSDEDHIIIANASSMGVTISPESPKTRRNSDAMAERDIEINGGKLRCEWHAKITATCGRIHFYARKGRPEKVKEKTGARVVIGVLAAHLNI